MPVEESNWTARRDPARPDPGRPDPRNPDPESVKPRWIWRTLGLSIPLHLAVFGMLYFGGMYLLEREMIRAHERDAQLLLLAAVNNLHLIMQNDSRDEARQQSAELAAAHRQLRLHLWTAAGEHISGGDSDLPAPREASHVEAFLGAPESERFWLDRSGDGGPYLRGMVRLRTDERCQPCHEPGETRGVASMTQDLSPEIREQRSRLLLYVGVAAIAWGLLAAALNRMTARAFKRSAATVQAHLDAPAGVSSPSPGAAAQILDPMSTALFDSLRRSLDEHRQREEAFASRLQHTDRLASLGQLAAGLAHEIKNPLAGIQGALEILRDEAGDQAGDEAGDEPSLEVYDQMLAELRRVDGTIRSLLRFARPAPTHRRAVDVPGLLEDTVRLLRPGLARRGVELELETAPGVDGFPLDADQIRQVLVNLVNNAAEAIEQEPGAGGTVALRATRFPADGSLLLAVADDGPGIPEDEQERIFEPFFTSKFTGTGLGLAVADNLVTRHGGRIELESAPGKGSTFFVILPLPQGGKDSDGEEGDEEPES